MRLMREKEAFHADAYLDPSNVHIRASDGVPVVYGPHGFEAPLTPEQQEVVDGIAAGTTPSYDERLRDWQESNRGEDLYDATSL